MNLGKTEGNSLIWEHYLQQVQAWLISDLRHHKIHPRKKSSKDHYLVQEVTKKPQKLSPKWSPTLFTSVRHPAPISSVQRSPWHKEKWNSNNAVTGRWDLQNSTSMVTPGLTCDRSTIQREMQPFQHSWSSIPRKAQSWHLHPEHLSTSECLSSE